jgi:hypothetical protein
MRAALPGTDHSTTLHRLEGAILHAIGAVAGITKIEPLYIKQTGSARVRLQLHDASARVNKNLVQAWLFIGQGKRLLLIGLHPLVTIQMVQQRLQKSLRRFGVQVEVRVS